MQYEEFIGIETSLTYKYKNHIFPEIVNILKPYLFDNPDKHEYYISKIIKVDELIKYVVNHESLKNKIDILDCEILDVIKEYVEVITWKL